MRCVVKKIPYGKYTKEFREEAVKHVTVKGCSVDNAAQRLSLPKSTLANWVKAFRAGKLGKIGKHYREKSEVELEIAQLKRELAGMKMERDILKKAAAYFGVSCLATCEEVPERYAMINELRSQYPVPSLCRVFQVSLSGYYRWCTASNSRWQKDETRLEAEISAAHQ